MNQIVIFPVQFDHQVLSRTGEINNIRGNRMLATEMVAVQSSATKSAPEDMLRMRFLFPEFSG